MITSIYNSFLCLPMLNTQNGSEIKLILILMSTISVIHRISTCSNFGTILLKNFGCLKCLGYWFKVKKKNLAENYSMTHV